MAGEERRVCRMLSGAPDWTRVVTLGTEQEMQLVVERGHGSGAGEAHGELHSALAMGTLMLERSQAGWARRTHCPWEGKRTSAGNARGSGRALWIF